MKVKIKRKVRKPVKPFDIGAYELFCNGLYRQKVIPNKKKAAKLKRKKVDIREYQPFLLVALQKTPSLLGAECQGVGTTPLHANERGQTVRFVAVIEPPVYWGISMPTVALDGSVPGEWTTEKEVVIDETKEVSLHSLRENGVHIFAIDKKDNDLVKNLMAGKTIDKQIRLFEEMAAHPDKTYAAENGNLQKIKVKDYYNKNQTSLNAKILSALNSRITITS